MGAGRASFSLSPACLSSCAALHEQYPRTRTHELVLFVSVLASRRCGVKRYIMAMMEASVESSVASSIMSTCERPPPVNPQVAHPHLFSNLLMYIGTTGVLEAPGRRR